MRYLTFIISGAVHAPDKLDVQREREKKVKKNFLNRKKNRFFVCVSSEEDIKTLMITIFKDDILQQH